jgi:hypothetical protein
VRGGLDVSDVLQGLAPDEPPIVNVGPPRWLSVSTLTDLGPRENSTDAQRLKNMDPPINRPQAAPLKPAGGAFPRTNGGQREE